MRLLAALVAPGLWAVMMCLGFARWRPRRAPDVEPPRIDYTI